MNEAEISVLIPLYNSKIYIEDCVRSVLRQTFQNFEIVICDDFSTDGAFAFVKEIFAEYISAGKIRLFQNAENLGEAATLKKLIELATGKYITILHNDDLYMPDALEHLFEVAEKFQADVVHGSNFLTSEKDGVIVKGTPLHKVCCDSNPATSVEIMPSDLDSRFEEWTTGGTFQDAQYNIFRRQFIFESQVLDGIENSNTYLTTLHWLMTAKIFVKTPKLFYIRRDCPTSQTNDRSISDSRLERQITSNILLFRQVDKFVTEFDFFSGKKDLQYLVKSKIFKANESLTADLKKVVLNKGYVDLYYSIENVFKKHFGADGVYLAMLYHWSHIMQFNKSKIQTMLNDCLNLIGKDI